MVRFRKQKRLSVETLEPRLVLNAIGFDAAALNRSPLESVIVVLKDDAPNSAAMAHALVPAETGRVGYVYEHALKGFSAQLPAAAIAALAQNPHVKYVEQDGMLGTAGQLTFRNVTRIGGNLNTTADIDNSPNRLYHSDPEVDPDSTIDVAILDTGIDIDHPDLMGNIAGGVYFNASLVPDDNESAYNDGNGHGTHVAGIVGAMDNNIVSVGVAPGVRLWAVKILENDGYGSWSQAIAGMDWVTATRTNVDTSDDIEVANLSVTGPWSQAVNDAVARMVDAGIFVSVAAGNNAANAGNYSPASEPKAFTVSAMVDMEGQPGGLGIEVWTDGLDDTMASFSNYGSVIDIAAPGVYVYSSWINGDVANISGTSMASPHAAGAAALYIANHGRPSDAAGVQAIADALIALGEPMADWRPDNLDIASDRDSFHEPLLNISSVPRTRIVMPAEGATVVPGLTMIQIAANDFEDPAGTDGPTVEWSVKQGNNVVVSEAAEYNLVTGYYDATWDAAGLSGIYVVSAHATDASKTTTTDTNTIIVANPGDRQILFADSFENGQWNGFWVEDSQNDWFTSTQRKTDGSYSAEVDGLATDAKLSIASPVDLRPYGSAEITFDWLIESGLDTGEYLALDLYNGAVWQEVAKLRGNVDPENTWRHEVLTIYGDYLVENFQLRFRAKMSGSDEDANVDNVQLAATSLARPNIAPTAADDEADTVDEDGTLVVAAPGVLGNDIDADRDPLTAHLLGGVSSGSLTLNPDGSFSYSSAADFNGSDSFTYRAFDGIAYSDAATVTLTVNPVNDAPVAVNDSASTQQDKSVMIPLLVNDSDVDSGSLAIQSLTDPPHGTVTDNGNGTVTYTPDPGYTGEDMFGYTVTDGQLTDDAIVTINVQPPQVTHIFSDNTQRTIPDRGTTTSTITVPTVMTLLDVNVQITISHARDQDLDVYLRSPDGTRVQLFTDVGGNGDNFTGTILDDQASLSITAGSAPFTGTYRPEGSLAALNGEGSAGVWALEVSDDARSYVGTLNSWSLILTGEPTAPAPAAASASLAASLPEVAALDATDSLWQLLAADQAARQRGNSRGGKTEAQWTDLALLELQMQ